MARVGIRGSTGLNALGVAECLSSIPCVNATTADYRDIAGLPIPYTVDHVVKMHVFASL